MRTHGWGGATPSSDEEAVQRILTAARRAIDERGGDMRLADVARDLAVTRQTVYRYFRSTEDLLVATAVSDAGPFLDGLADHVAGLHDPAEAVTEAIAHTLEQLPKEKYLGILLTVDRAGAFSAGVTSDIARGFGRSMIDRFAVDWSSAGLDDEALDGMVEHMLRVVQSFVIDPGDPPRTGDDLRDYLREWVAPAITHHRQRRPRRRSAGTAKGGRS
jgi:AcrR family transcriptional regulator